MEFNILFNDISFKKDLTSLDIKEVDNIDTNKISDTICRGTFSKQRIIDAINESTFTIFVLDKNIVGIMCISIYKHKQIGYMWEISYICSDEGVKGIGSILIDKLKKVAKTYTHMLPITIYGLALYPASEQLYLRNNFINNQFIITGGTKKNKKTSKKTYKKTYKKTSKKLYKKPYKNKKYNK